ncbi:MAG: class I SAM-dependent methyltransferase [bacterium]|nr:class I SAM-dependent methyltransferase [bacterium]
MLKTSVNPAGDSDRGPRAWYEAWFDEDYLALYSHRNVAEAEQFVDTLWSRLGLQVGAWVADVSCGAGRHSLAFARCGANVVGVDLSRVMLDRARQDFHSQCSNVRFVRGDMRHIPLASGFQLAVNLFTSLGYFESEAENERAFAELARLLVRAGTLVVDVVNPVYLRASFLSETVREFPGMAVWEYRKIDEPRRRIVKEIEIRRGARTRRICESVRLYERAELASMATKNGLAVLDFWGDYDGSALEENSPRLILVARKE